MDKNKILRYFNKKKDSNIEKIEETFTKDMGDKWFKYLETKNEAEYKEEIDLFFTIFENDNNIEKSKGFLTNLYKFFKGDNMVTDNYETLETYFQKYSDFDLDDIYCIRNYVQLARLGHVYGKNTCIKLENLKIMEDKDQYYLGNITEDTYLLNPFLVDLVTMGLKQSKIPILVNKNNIDYKAEESQPRQILISDNKILKKKLKEALQKNVGFLINTTINNHKTHLFNMVILPILIYVFI